MFVKSLEPSVFESEFVSHYTDTHLNLFSVVLILPLTIKNWGDF